MANEEPMEAYVLGGYHPIKTGDTLSDGRYVVVRKLSWGVSSTVWLAKDQKMDHHVALKVVRSAESFTKIALNEIKVLRRLMPALNPPSPAYTDPAGRSHVISLIDDFRHEGPNGSHVCIVFEVLCENTRSLCRAYRSEGGLMPMTILKQIVKQVLLGLDYMHRCCGIIHADLKPESILIAMDDVESVVQSELRSSMNPDSTSQSPSESQFSPHPSSSAFSKSNPQSNHIGFFLPGSGHAMSSVSPYPEDAFINQSQSVLSTHSSGMLGKTKIGMANWKEGTGGNNGDGFLGQPVSNDDNGGDGGVKRNGNVNVSGVSIGDGDDVDRYGSARDVGADSSDIEQNGHRNHVPGVEVGKWNDASVARREAELTVKIVGFTNSTLMEDLSLPLYPQWSYRSPEVILGAKFGPSTDIWSLGCLVFELITGNGYLFDPTLSSEYSRDNDHIVQIMELMGDMPKSIALSGTRSSEFFTTAGELRNTLKPDYRGIEAVLREKHQFSAADATAISSFLTAMLQVDPEKRLPAHELVRHPWLTGEVVQDKNGVGDEQVEVKEFNTDEALSGAAGSLPTRKRGPRGPQLDGDCDADNQLFEGGGGLPMKRHEIKNVDLDNNGRQPGVASDVVRVTGGDEQVHYDFNNAFVNGRIEPCHAIALESYHYTPGQAMHSATTPGCCCIIL